VYGANPAVDLHVALFFKKKQISFRAKRNWSQDRKYFARAVCTVGVRSFVTKWAGVVRIA